jgi:ribosomal protein S12 methylthiotransferase accessory factor
VHALYEQIERDCTSVLARLPVRDRTIVDPTSVDDAHCAALIDLIRSVGGWVEIADATAERWRPVRCFSCNLWLPDMGAMVGGSGAHLDPAIALSRAITEAVQSRLTFIVGSRDDINPRVYGDELTRPPAAAPATVLWTEAGAVPLPATDVEELDLLATLVASVTGTAPMRVDLTRPEEAEDFAVVKTLSPGLDFLSRHDLPRPE